MKQTEERRRYILVLASVAAGILIIGSALRPDPLDEAESAAISAPSEGPFLQRMTLRRSVDDMAQYFSDLANRLEPHVVRLEKSGRSAIVWDGGSVATACDGCRLPDKDIALRPSQRNWRVWPQRVAPNLPAALLETSEEDPPRATPRYSAEFFTAGGWAVAAWRTDDGRLGYAAGQYLGPTRCACQGIEATLLRTNIPLSEEMFGGGLFDVDGVLMGIVVHCGGELVAIDVGTLERSFGPPQIVSERLMARYGMLVGELSPLARKALDAEYGLQVEEVWTGWESYRAGLLPGDVILSVDSQPATSMADLEPLVLPVAREQFDLQILRQGAERRIRLSARAEGIDPFGPHGLGVSDPARGYPITSVEPGSPAGSAGLLPGDRLLWLDSRRPESAQQIREIIEKAAVDNPVFAIVQRGTRIWGAFIT